MLQNTIKKIECISSSRVSAASGLPLWRDRMVNVHRPWPKTRNLLQNTIKKSNVYLPVGFRPQAASLFGATGWLTSIVPGPKPEICYKTSLFGLIPIFFWSYSVFFWSYSGFFSVLFRFFFGLIPVFFGLIPVFFRPIH